MEGTVPVEEPQHRFKGPSAMRQCRIGLLLILALAVAALVGAAAGSQRFDATAESSPLAEFFAGPLKVDADPGAGPFPCAQGAAGAGDRPGLFRHPMARPHQRPAESLRPICVQPRSPPRCTDRIA